MVLSQGAGYPRLLHHGVWGVRFPLDTHDLEALPDRPEIDPNPTIPHRVLVA